MQGRLQLPNLALRAFDHPSPPKQMARWNHKISLPSGTKLPQTPRFNKLWKRYESIRREVFQCPLQFSSRQVIEFRDSDVTYISPHGPREHCLYANEVAGNPHIGRCGIYRDP